MKKNILIATTLSVALGLGGLAGAILLQPRQSEQASKNVLTDATEQNGVAGIKLEGADVSSSEASSGSEADTDIVNSALGVKVSPAKADGSRDLSFVAALKDYRSLAAANFTRVMKTEDGSDLKASADVAVHTVYTTASDYSYGEGVSLGEDYHYFMTYTMTGIPQEYFFAKLSVTLHVVTDTGETFASALTEANVQGLLGDASIGVTYLPNAVTDGQPQTYGAQALNTDITEAVVAPYVLSINGFVATRLGKVTSLSMRNSSTGAFDSCGKLASIVLPDTIQEFQKWSFYNCGALSEMTFPTSLVALGSSCFSNNAWKVLHYNASALVNASDMISWNLNDVIVSKDVVSLPDKLISASYLPKSVHYFGTTAEWNALEGTKANGLGIDTVYCSDSVLRTVTFVLNGATLSVDGTSYSDTYTQSIIDGKLVKNPGAPTLEGKYFEGWYADAAFETPFDFTAAISSDVSVYAHITELPAGVSFDKAQNITDGFSGTAVTNTAYADYVYYYRFTAQTTDTYYFTIANPTLNLDLPHTTTAASMQIKVYDASKNEMGLSAYDPTTSAIVAGDQSAFARIACTAGDVYYVSVTPRYYFSSSTWSGTTETYGYGSVDLSVTTLDHDTPSEAISYAYGETVKVPFVTGKEKLFFSFVASSTADSLFRLVPTGSLWGSFVLYKGGDKLTKVTSVYGTAVTSAIVSLTEGTTYYIEANTNDVPKESKYLSFSLGEVPAGAKTDTAIPVSANQNTTVSLGTTGLRYFYYSFVAPTSNVYLMSSTAASTTSTRSITVYASDATTQLATATTTAADSGTLLNFAATASTTYIIKAGFDSSYGDRPDFAFVLKEAPAGYTYANAIAIDASIGTHAMSVLTSDAYYQFSTTDASTLQFAFAVSAGTPNVTFYNSAKTKVGSVTTANGNCHFDVAASSTYYLVVKGGTAADLTMTVSAFSAPLTGKAFLGNYMGAKNGASYYKMSLVAEGYTWESGSTVNALSIASEADGIATLSGSDISIVTNNTQALIIKGGDRFFMSKNCTNYSSGSISGQEVKTSGATNTVGVFLESVVRTSDSGREYAMLKDGVTYLGVTVSFNAGTSIKDTGADFLVTASDGTTVLGHYSNVDGSTISAI
jgi:uncharacterized repeat protein (TIGR02543 family)